MSTEHKSALDSALITRSGHSSELSWAGDPDCLLRVTDQEGKDIKEEDGRGGRSKVIFID